MSVPLNTVVSFTSLQPLIKEAAHMHEQLKMDKWQKCCCSVGYKTHSSLSSWNTYFNEYGRYFAEMAHSCHTEKISRCYFQNYPHNLLPPCESSPPPKDLRWEPKERVMTLLCGEKKYFLESFVLGKKSIEDQVNEAERRCS